MDCLKQFRLKSILLIIFELNNFGLNSNNRAIHAVTGKRGFVVSRSTYVSSGRYGSHWLGDNRSEWTHLKWSLIGILEMNFFGIPFVCSFE